MIKLRSCVRFYIVMKLYSLRRGFPPVCIVLRKSVRFFRISPDLRKWTLRVQNIICGSMPRTPLKAFAFGTCFENRSLFIPKSVPESGIDLFVIYGFLSLWLLIIICIILGSSFSSDYQEQMMFTWRLKLTMSTNQWARIQRYQSLKMTILIP